MSFALQLELFAIQLEGVVQRCVGHPGFRNGETGELLTPSELVPLGYLPVVDDPPAYNPGIERLTALPIAHWTVAADHVLVAYRVDTIPFEELRDRAHDRINTEYETRVAELGTGYPEQEQKSWPTQAAEAAIVLGADDSPTPWIDASAAAEGVTRQNLAQRIADMDAAYRAIHGTLSGIRRKLRDQIAAVPDDEHAAAAFAAIEWPHDEPPGEIEPEPDPT